MMRERLSWREIEPSESLWHWNGRGATRGYDVLRGQLARNDVPVLEMFHDAPEWAGTVGKYPENLVAASRSWIAICRHWRHNWGALEVWNEPDIFFGGNLPADQYVALVKTIAWSYDRTADDQPSHDKKNGNSRSTTGVRPPLVGGVFAHHDREFLDAAAANGLLEAVDAASFHTYGRAEQIEELVRRFRDWLARHGHRGKPLWITECGRPWKRGPDRPPADQDAVGALDITMKAVEARACGVARYFAFVYPFYEEREWNFGMMGRRAAPLRSMAAYVQCAARLGRKRYLGDLKCGDPTVRRARVFGDSAETVVVLYTGRVAADATVQLGLPVLQAEGIDGRRLPVRNSQAVPVPDGLTYVRVDRRAIESKLHTDTEAAKLIKAACAPTGSRLRAASIVLRYQYDAQRLEAASRGYRVKDEPVKGAVFAARLFNLADRDQDVTIALRCGSGNDAVGRPHRRQVRVPAASHMEVRWIVDQQKALAHSGLSRWTLVASSPTAGRILPLTVDIRGEPNLSQVLDRFADRIRLAVDRPTRWKSNAVGHGRMTVRRGKNGGVRFQAVFGQGDRWFYPVFNLDHDINAARYHGLVIQARTGSRGKVRLIVWEGNSGVAYLSRELPIPPDGKWHTAIVRFETLALSGANAPDPDGRLDLKDVRRISFGMNTPEEDAWLEIRECFLIGGAK